MDIKQAIVASLDASDAIVQAYLADLTNEELLVRSLPGTNHIAWQLGHLIGAEHFFVERVLKGTIAPLPEGFGPRHKKETAASDKPADFLRKDEYLALAKQVRSSALETAAKLPAEAFDGPVTHVPPMVKNVGGLFLFLGSHWLMHAGQWAIIRRKLNRPPLF